MTDKPQRVLPITSDGKRDVISLDNVQTREDVVSWVKFHNPMAQKSYIDTSVGHIWRAIQKARGEDDITYFENLLVEIQNSGYDIDVSGIERIIRHHYLRREAFHPRES